MRSTHSISARRNRTRRPEVECLEERSLLSVTGSINAAGTLVIQGSSGSDSIRISNERVVTSSTRDASGRLIVFMEDMIKVSSSTIPTGGMFGLLNPTLYFRATAVARLAVYAGDGNDYVRNGTALRSSMYGEAGNDVMYGGSGSDRMYGGNGNNEMHGGDGDDYLMGGRGIDLLYGDAGSDFLDGADVYDAATGNDILDGGAGYDYSQERVRTTYQNIERIWSVIWPPVDESPMG